MYTIGSCYRDWASGSVWGIVVGGIKLWNWCKSLYQEKESRAVLPQRVPERGRQGSNVYRNLRLPLAFLGFLVYNDALQFLSLLYLPINPAPPEAVELYTVTVVSSVNTWEK